MIEEFTIESFEYEKKGKFKGLRWDVSDMMKEKFRQKCSHNPSFYRVFNEDNNLTKPFRREIKFRTRGEKNIIIEITGQTGIGKTIISITLALDWMGKPLILDDICFTTDDLLKRAMNVGKSHVLLQDEQINQLGVGSNREQYERQTLEDTTRKFGLSIIFCSPTTKDHTTAHYNLEVICINRRKRLSKVAIIGSGGQYMGYFVIRVIKESHPLWKAYNKKKDEFIQGILSRSTKRLSLDDMSLSLKKHKQFRYANTKEQRKVVCMKLYPTLTTQEIGMVVENLSMLENMGGVDED